MHVKLEKQCNIILFSDCCNDNKSIIHVREYPTNFFSEVLIIMHRTVLITMRDHVSCCEIFFKIY